MFILGWTIPSSLEANLAIFKCFSQGTKLDLKQMNNLISYTWSTRQCPPNPKPMFYCHSSCLDEGYVPNTVGKLPTCNLQLKTLVYYYQELLKILSRSVVFVQGWNWTLQKSRAPGTGLGTLGLNESVNIGLPLVDIYIKIQLSNVCHDIYVL